MYIHTIKDAKIPEYRTYQVAEGFIEEGVAEQGIKVHSNIGA